MAFTVCSRASLPTVGSTSLDNSSACRSDGASHRVREPFSSPDAQASGTQRSVPVVAKRVLAEGAAQAEGAFDQEHPNDADRDQHDGERCDLGIGPILDVVEDLDRQRRQARTDEKER